MLTHAPRCSLRLPVSSPVSSPPSALAQPAAAPRAWHEMSGSDMSRQSLKDDLQVGCPATAPPFLEVPSLLPSMLLLVLFLLPLLKRMRLSLLPLLLWLCCWLRLPLSAAIPGTSRGRGPLLPSYHPRPDCPHLSVAPDCLDGTFCAATRLGCCSVPATASATAPAAATATAPAAATANALAAATGTVPVPVPLPLP
jgi:hypothetical protein